jgi:hypothetical protein
MSAWAITRSCRHQQLTEIDQLKEREMDRTALVTFSATAWSGWSPDHHSIVTSTQLKVDKGTSLNPTTLGFRKADYDDHPGWFYEVVVERIVEDRVQFGFRNVVVNNPGGGINLSGPTTGKFILRCGETNKLSTPTMDAGISLAVTLDEIH